MPTFSNLDMKEECDFLDSKSAAVTIFFWIDKISGSTTRISHAISIIPLVIYPFKPELTIVIFIHYKPRIAVAILDL